MTARNRMRDLRKAAARGGRGQALVEFAVCLIGFLSVIAGFLLIAGLSVENVHNAILSREKTDTRARSGVSEYAGKNIRDWDWGEDNLMFTKDDVAVAAASSPGVLFQRELKDTSGTLDLADRSGLNSIPSSNNFARNLNASSLFLLAANLSSFRVRETDPLGKRNLSSLKGLIKALIINPEFTLEDTTYMPATPVLLQNAQ